MTRMAGSLNVYETFKSLRASTNWAKWAGANPGGADIINYVLELREANGET
jgi:hypothetical protein